jgi:multiple antibiotic resistance protein
VDIAQFVNHFIALLVIANPLSLLPAVLRITRQETPEDKKKLGTTTGIAVAIILLTTTWIGTPLLQVLGIKLAAFQIAGGMILFTMAFSMLHAEESSIKHSPDDSIPRKATASAAIVPLAMPMIAGPAAISTIIVSISEFPGVETQILLSISSLLVAFVMGILVHFAARVEKALGQSGVNIINRLGGLVLLAIAVQSFAIGATQLFPGLDPLPSS